MANHWPYTSHSSTLILAQFNTSPQNASLPRQPNRTLSVAGTRESHDLNRRRKRRKTDTLSNFGWPSGLFLSLLLLLFGALIADAAHSDNRVAWRWKRSISNNPLPKDAVLLSSESGGQIERIQRLTTTRAPAKNVSISTTTAIPTLSLSSTSTPRSTVSDILLDSESIIVFTRTVHYNGEEFRNTEKKTEEFKINSTMTGELKFECESGVRNRRYQRNNITFETYWVDVQSFKVVSNNSILVFDNAWERLKDVEFLQLRCAARLAIPDRSIESTIHSRYISLRPVSNPVLQLKPLSIDVVHAQSARLECEYNITGGQVQDIFWMNGSTRLTKHEDYKIYTTQTRSILYIFNIHMLYGQEPYSCQVLLKNGELLNSTEVTKLNVYDEVKDLVFSQEKILPVESMEARVNDDLSIECWDPDAKHIRWYRLHSSTLREMISTEPVLLFKNASARLNGNYECQLEDQFGILRFYRIDVYVDDNFFQIEPVTYSIVRKNQGTPAKLLCRTFQQYEELPYMAEWFKDGSPLNSPEDLVYRRTSLVDDPGKEGRAAYIAMTQVEDQGFYECFIRKEDTERAQLILLLIEQKTDQRLTNLTMSVDHTRGCFSSQFNVPQSVDFRVAQRSTYFLVYFLSDMSKPLNIIPGIQGAKCTPDNRCTVSCWTPSYPFEPATNYTFRLSAVFIDDTSAITPFSNAVSAISWDGQATRGVQFNWLYDSKEKKLFMTWKRPQVIGTLKQYRVELIELDVNSPTTKNPPKKFNLRIKPEQENYTVGDVNAPFALQIRMIPMTRSGLPPTHHLQSDKDFGYTWISADENAPPTDISIPPPEIQIQQINSEPKFEVNFNQPTLQEHNATSIQVQYRPIASVHKRLSLSSKETEFETPMNIVNSDGKSIVVLRNGLKVGNIYQICAAYERHDTVPPTLGFWHCENVPLLDKSGQLNSIREEALPTEARHLIPNPIDCQKSNCTCAQSTEDRNLVLIRWRSPNSPLLFKSGMPKYVIHYELNNTDIKKIDSKSRYYRDGNYTTLELRGLFPTLTYNIMIEAQNEMGVGLDGTYFACVAPPGLDLPPPEPSDVTVLGTSGNAQIYWKPPIPLHMIKTVPDFIGYAIHLRTGNASEQVHTIKGHQQSSDLLSSLQPGFDYSVYLTSLSATKGDSSLMSKSFTISMPALKQESPPEKPSDHDKVQDLLAADKNFPWYKTLRFRIFIVLAIVGLVIIICFAGLAALISIKYYDWFQSPEAKERRRLKRMKKAPSLAGISSGRASKASSRLSLNSIGSGSQIPSRIHEQDILIPNLYGVPYRDSIHKKNMLDLKGGPHGYRPSKGRQADNVLNDPNFKQKVQEVNKDPTGLGKPWNEILADLKRAQEEEIALLRQKEGLHHEDIEMQTFRIHQQYPYASTSGTSVPSISSSTSRHSHKHRRSSGSNHRRRPKLNRQLAESSPLTTVNQQISSIDDDENYGRPLNKRESVQVEIHQEPSPYLMFAPSSTNRLPSKTHSLNDLNSIVNQPKCVVPDSPSEGWLQNPVLIKKHQEPMRRNFLKRPSIISLQNNRCYPTASTLQTPQSPQSNCPIGEVIIHDDQQSNHATPLEFHFGTNGIERRRLKTTTATPTHQQQRKKCSVGGNVATASLPNLNDSGIVYDESGHNFQHHHTYFHHPSQGCPSGLHPIVSMKLLRLENEESKNDERLEETPIHPDFLHHRQNLDDLRPPGRRQSLADGESAISTSSGASSHESGASNRYELNDAEIDDESGQLISPQTPVRSFGSSPGTIIIHPSVYHIPPSHTKDYCSIQMCNFNAHEEKRPLEMLNNESLNDGLQSAWFGKV